MEEERASHYVLPRHPTENDRLNLQTWAIDAMNGANYLSPVTDPHDVLDVGCGTGDWAYRIGRRFREARVVGIDIEDFRDTGAPPNFEFVQVNVLKGLPFEDASFDFVHQRLMVAAYPIVRFAEGIGEIVRVARPGAWIELTECAVPMERMGPVTEKLVDYFNRLYRSAGLDWEGMIPRRLERYLTDAGLMDVAERTVEIPMGPWGAELGEMQGRTGAMQAAAFRSVFDKLNVPMGEGQPSALERMGLDVEHGREMIATALTEYDTYKSAARFKTAWGRKP